MLGTFEMTCLLAWGEREQELMHAHFMLASHVSRFRALSFLEGQLAFPDRQAFSMDKRLCIGFHNDKFP